MITFRREQLDRFLEANLPLMKGHVLDVGGRKDRKRGRFRPPLPQTSSWKYVNPDPAAQPDFVATAEKLPVESGSVDLVVMTEVLEYVGDPAQALREVGRVLKSGGTALLSAPLLSPVHGDAEFDKFRFTKSGLRHLAGQSGFRHIEIHEMGGLGAVLFDLCEAASGYANPGERRLRVKATRKLLFASVPIFRFLDWLSRGSIPFVTTGYFVILRKSA